MNWLYLTLSQFTFAVSDTDSNTIAIPDSAPALSPEEQIIQQRSQIFSSLRTRYDILPGNNFTCQICASFCIEQLRFARVMFCALCIATAFDSFLLF